MPSNLDHVADVNGTELVRLSKLYEFPQFVKQANLEQVMRKTGRAVTVYADPIRKQFPCDSAADTFLSALYFTEKRAEFHPKDASRIQNRLNHYISYWRIEPAIARMYGKHAEYVREKDAELPDSAYAYLHVNQDTGKKTRHLRMINAKEVQAAAEYLETHRDRFVFKDRNAMAKRILEKAAKYGAAVKNREFLEKQAGLGVCDPEQVVALLQDRAHLAKLPALKEKLIKMAATVRDQPRQALTPDMLVELATTVDTVDQGLGLYGRYSQGVPRPEDVIFSATFSKAAADVAEHCALTTGKVYRKADFGRVKLADLESLFGTDFAAEVRHGFDSVDPEKMAELAATLPFPDAQLLDHLMAESGLTPQLQKAASACVGFNEADLQELAKQYAGAVRPNRPVAAR